uniref:Serpin peptidase inhibitor, clade E (nexin, plasminogen activator inhibitor type 1), member 3 n=1 Tax=Amphiprion percula TaxID=161767 RepID=A0A3P8SVZ9_AMPPE
RRKSEHMVHSVASACLSASGPARISSCTLHTRLAVSLYQKLTQTENTSNLIMSPTSVSLSPALLQLGARGNTLAQLEGTLGYSVNDAQVQDFLLHSQGGVSNSSQGMWLQQTCTLFIQSGVQLLPQFTQHAAAWANTNVVRANFSQPNQSHSQSGSSSVELSGSGEAQAEALWWGHHLQVVLVNMVAFRGVWQKQFLFTNTQNLPFILSDETPIKVPMMYQAAEVSFASSPSALTVFALTMVLLKRSRAPVFKADRPFLFLLRQVQTGIYFTSYRCFQCFSREKHPSQVLPGQLSFPSEEVPPPAR